MTTQTPYQREVHIGNLHPCEQRNSDHWLTFMQDAPGISGEGEEEFLLRLNPREWKHAVRNQGQGEAGCPLREG